jgi:hypothetical protein
MIMAMSERRIYKGGLSFVAACLISIVAPATAHAQIDLTGLWNNPLFEDTLDRTEGPRIGDYTGLPLNAAGRLFAESWDAAILSVPERQCNDYPADYASNSIANIDIWKELDPLTHAVIAWRTKLAWMGGERTIWMDGRPHPSEDAPHTWLGFSTGRWEGGSLIVTTTHLKNTWLRRNGPPRSDKATLVERFTRHGNYLTIVTSIYDPVYYTEPVVRSRDFINNPNGSMGGFVCETVEEIARPIGDIPHALPGENKFLTEFATMYGIPLEATRGGAETIYPEYRTRLATLPRPAPAPPAPPATARPQTPAR